MDYKEVECLDRRNPLCLCTACLNFFENGLDRVLEFSHNRSVIYLAQNGFAFRQHNLNSGVINNG